MDAFTVRDLHERTCELADIVTDNGPLVAFARLSQRVILHGLFGQILVPDVIISECTLQPHHPGTRAIRAMMLVHKAHKGAGEA